ncbi:MAG TPA: DUF2059 domain-containing protein [Flavobacterium sp.]|uniref:DUF2059 domain-containing protein n=1 Tax=unclassified Flavobacterium TaxID=196869 RepID=UPI0025B8BA73|nr:MULTISPECIES: DUF2059 domain-containing protein [unclassified Flavobacterium]HRE76426.1 DUF2059 domain-containing protein [Flavobacterium sp.]
MRTVLLFVAVLFCNFCFSQEKEDIEFKNDVLKLIETTGIKNHLLLVKNQFIKNVPQDKKAVFEKEFELSLTEMLNNYAKIYMKLYTKEDIKAMMAFYDSPIGKKIQANADEMTMRTKANSQEWTIKLQALVSKLQLPE